MRAFVLCVLLVACGGADDKSDPVGGGDTDTGEADPGPDGADSGDSADSADSTDTSDSGDSGGDTGSDTGEDTGEDTGTEDPWPLDGMGTLTGDCGDHLDPTVLADDTPRLVQTVLDLGTDGFNPEALSEGGTEVWEDGNLGGSSAESEVVAYEVLYRCEGASLLKTEAEVIYTDPGGKKTDLIVEVDGFTLGVSVTRAVGWPREDPYTIDHATDLLSDKLADIPISTANVSPEDAWSRQILSVIAYAPEHAASIEAAWLALDPTLRGDTLLMVTATDGNDDALY